MPKITSDAVVHFLEGEAPRRFATLEQAIAFLTTFCPQNLRATAWITTAEKIIGAPEIQSLSKEMHLNR